jgi:hypothetical protein
MMQQALSGGPLPFPPIVAALPPIGGAPAAVAPVGILLPFLLHGAHGHVHHGMQRRDAMPSTMILNNQ